MATKLGCSALSVLLFMALLFVSVSAYAYEDYISLDRQTKEQSNWCWAACASTILDYHAQTVSQTSFATYVLNSPSNFSATTIQVKNGLSHWGVSSTHVTSYVSYDVIRAEINTYSRPIYAKWTWTEGGGHAVVIDGYCTDSVNYVDYMDPDDGAAHFATYTWVVGGSGYDHTWDQTLKSIHD